MNNSFKDAHPIQHAMAQMVTGLHERPENEYTRRKLIAMEKKVHQQLRELAVSELEEYDVY